MEIPIHSKDICQIKSKLAQVALSAPCILSRILPPALAAALIEGKNLEYIVVIL